MSGPRLHIMESIILQNAEFPFKWNTPGAVVHPLAPAAQTPPFKKFPDSETPASEKTERCWSALVDPSPNPRSWSWPSTAAFSTSNLGGRRAGKEINKHDKRPLSHSLRH